MHVGAFTSIFPKIGCTSIRPIGDYDIARMITWNNLQRNGSLFCFNLLLEEGVSSSLGAHNRW
jgi:hypothetical protein